MNFWTGVGGGGGGGWITVPVYTFPQAAYHSVQCRGSVTTWPSHRRRKQGGEGGGHPSRFFGLTETFESRSRVK